MPDILDRPLNGWWRDTQPLAALVASAGMPGQGPTFTMPLVVQEGVRVEDGRQFTPGGLTARSLPLPVMATWTTDDGHDGAVLVGLLTTLTRDQTGRWNGAGYFDTSPAAMEAARLVGSGILSGVSVDVASNDVTMTIPAELLNDGGENADGSITFPIAGELIDFQTAQIVGVTICPMPAFETARIVLDAEPPTMEAIAASAEGCPPCEAAMSALPRRALAAAAVETEAPPREWFEDPQLDGPTPLTVQADGRVFGHAALWGVCHRGISDTCVMAPKSSTDYAHFKVGAVLCDDGTTIPTGPLTVGTGHAGLSLDARGAARHYDDTGTAAADVAIGEDEHGIWVAGAIRPGATPEQVYALRASSLSGDWRPIGGRLELVAALAVNVPGFATVPYALAASLGWREKDGQMLALVAAGAAPLVQAKTPVTRQELDATLARLTELESIVAALKPVAVERALARVDADQLTERRNAAVEAARARLSG